MCGTIFSDHCVAKLMVVNIGMMTLRMIQTLSVLVYFLT